MGLVAFSFRIRVKVMARVGFVLGLGLGGRVRFGMGFTASFWVGVSFELRVKLGIVFGSV